MVVDKPSSSTSSASGYRKRGIAELGKKFIPMMKSFKVQFGRQAVSQSYPLIIVRKEGFVWLLAGRHGIGGVGYHSGRCVNA